MDDVLVMGFSEAVGKKKSLYVKLTTLIGVVANCRPDKMQRKGSAPLRHGS